MRTKFTRTFKWLSVGVIAALLAFLLAAWIGSSIPRNGEWQEPGNLADETVTILIGNNGIHTEIVMPVATRTIDWRGVFPLKDIGAPDAGYTHVAVSWGERSFFLETPTWADLNLFTAIGALGGGEGLLHAAYYVRPAPSHDFRELRITRAEYRALTEQIAGLKFDRP